MSHYKSNVRDQVFNLFEVLGVDKSFGEGAFSDLDQRNLIAAAAGRVHAALDRQLERKRGHGPTAARSRS